MVDRPEYSALRTQRIVSGIWGWILLDSFDKGATDRLFGPWPSCQSPTTSSCTSRHGTPPTCGPSSTYMCKADDCRAHSDDLVSVPHLPSALARPAAATEGMTRCTGVDNSLLDHEDPSSEDLTSSMHCLGLHGPQAAQPSSIRQHLEPARNRAPTDDVQQDEFPEYDGFKPHGDSFSQEKGKRSTNIQSPCAPCSVKNYMHSVVDDHAHSCISSVPAIDTDVKQSTCHPVTTCKSQVAAEGHWRSFIADVPGQLDDSSCGYFMLGFADLLMQGFAPPYAFSQADIADLRVGIAALFLKLNSTG